MPTIKLIVFLSSLSLLSALPPAYGQKPLLSLDDFFDSVDIRAIQISPDGHDVIIETVRADWPSNSFRNDLVAGADDITVCVGEDYLLERALRREAFPTPC